MGDWTLKKAAEVKYGRGMTAADGCHVDDRTVDP
jgi:hypothetical protein